MWIWALAFVSMRERAHGTADRAAYQHVLCIETHFIFIVRVCVASGRTALEVVKWKHWNRDHYVTQLKIVYVYTTTSFFLLQLSIVLSLFVCLFDSYIVQYWLVSRVPVCAFEVRDKKRPDARLVRMYIYSIHYSVKIGNTNRIVPTFHCLSHSRSLSFSHTHKHVYTHTERNISNFILSKYCV